MEILVTGAGLTQLDERIAQCRNVLGDDVGENRKNFGM